VPHVLPNERSARDIDAAVSKILRDLDDPEPPLRLELVREALSLDRQYYSASDTGVLQEVVHRLRVGAKQAIKRPGLLLDVVRNRKLNALWIPDRRRILIDQDLPSAKHRWNEAHEIGHSLIPWHEDVAHGDNQLTLRMECELEIEGEANYAAGRLLFLQDRFTEEIRSGKVDLARVRALSKSFGNTITSTLWRTVESVGVPAFGLVSQHPLASKVNDGEPLVDHFIALPGFLSQFPAATGEEMYMQLRTFCKGTRGPIGAGEIVLQDVAGESHVFFVECFYNGHRALTLGLHRGVRRFVVGVVS
jgi:hypothetical protein